MRLVSLESLKSLICLVSRASLLTCLALSISAQAATVVISSRDAPGMGFNDATPTMPIGGNNGTTLGQQRLNVYRYVANLWGKALQSDVNITVSAGWEALSCSSNAAVLGSAGAWNIWHGFPGGLAMTWYPQALANKLYGANLSAGNPDDGSGYGNVDIKTQFNVNLGQTGCLDGSPFYLGLDGNSGSQINFVETLLHELGHGLGFSVLTVSTANGLRVNADGTAYTSDGLPSVWEGFMYDNTMHKTWLMMTPEQRQASAVNPLQLVWIGKNAVAGASFLDKQAILKIASPQLNIAGNYDYHPSAFGPPITTPSVFGSLAILTPQASQTGPGCDNYDKANTMAVRGKVVIVDRGACPFIVKVKNAQNAGAIGVLIVNNVSGALAPSGLDPTITIASAGISEADGNHLKAGVASALQYGSRGTPGTITAYWDVDPHRIVGADSQGRPLLYTPTDFSSGSSVSHWDSTTTPNLLMEPTISADLTTTLNPPKDLTVPLLKDLGW